MPDSPGNQLTYADLREAQRKFPMALGATHRGRIIGSKPGGSNDDGWHLVVYIENEKYRADALKVANEAIPDIPVEVSVTGKIRAL